MSVPGVFTFHSAGRKLLIVTQRKGSASSTKTLCPFNSLLDGVEKAILRMSQMMAALKCKFHRARYHQELTSYQKIYRMEPRRPGWLCAPRNRHLSRSLEVWCLISSWVKTGFLLSSSSLKVGALGTWDNWKGWLTLACIREHILSGGVSGARYYLVCSGKKEPQ